MKDIAHSFCCVLACLNALGVAVEARAEVVLRLHGAGDMRLAPTRQAAPTAAFTSADGGSPRLRLSSWVAVTAPAPVTVHPHAAGSQVPLTLEEAVALGLRNNRAIRAAHLQRVAQKFDLLVAEDRFAPRLSVVGAYGVSRQTAAGRSASASVAPTATVQLPTGARVSLAWDKTGSRGTNSMRQAGTGLSLAVEQPLLRDAGTDVNTAPVRAAQLDERINLAGLKETVSQSIAQIILAYRELLRAQAQRKIEQQALARARELLAINAALIKAGRMAKIDLLQTEAEVASHELALEEAENQIDAARLALLSLLALDAGTNIVPVDTLSVKAVAVNLHDALATALENQPEYLRSMLSADRARLTLKRAKNERLWDVALVASTSSQAGTSGGSDAVRDRTRENYVGVRVAIPIGDRAFEQEEVRAATALKTASLELEHLRQSVEQRVRDAVRNIETRWRQLEIAKRGCSLALRKLEAEREKLRSGRSSNFQVLSFETDLRNAENIQLNAMIAYLNAVTDLDQQSGTTLRTWNIQLND